MGLSCSKQALELTMEELVRLAKLKEDDINSYINELLVKLDLYDSFGKKDKAYLDGLLSKLVVEKGLVIQK